MEPQFKAKLISDIKTNTLLHIRTYQDLFKEFVDMLEKSDDMSCFEEMFDLIKENCDEKASSPFQRFLVGHITMKKTAMEMCIKFFEQHFEYEKEQMKKEENIDKLQDFFLKRSKEMYEKQAQG